MRVHARLHGFEPKERDVDVPAGASVADVLRALGIRRDLVLVFRGDRPVPDTDDVAEGETLRVVRIVSGGGVSSNHETMRTRPRHHRVASSAA